MLLLPLVVSLSLSLPQSLDVARAKWGTPACGEPRIEDSPSPPGGDAGFVLLWSDGTPVDCVIHADLAWGRRWDATCDTIVHEWGHLTGHGHSVDPGDIMYGRGLSSFAACHPLVTVYVSFREWDAAMADGGW